MAVGNVVLKKPFILSHSNETDFTVVYLTF